MNPSKALLEKTTQEIEEKAKALIKKTAYAHLSEHDAETLQDLKEGYKEWQKHTPASLKKKLYEDFVIRFTYNSNAISIELKRLE